MEVTTGPRNVPDSAIVSGLVLLLTTLLAGGVITFLIRYIVGRRSRSRQEQDSSKTYCNQSFVPAAAPYPYMPSPPTKPVYYDNYPSVNKRAKNKRRRELQQERTHPWMAGTLKGHTSTVRDVDFSSNGKYLASCAEDQSLQPPEISEQWIHNRSGPLAIPVQVPTYDSVGTCSETTLPSMAIDCSRRQKNRSRSFATQPANNFAHKRNNERKSGESRGRSRRHLPFSSPDDEEAIEQAVIDDKKEDYKIARREMTITNNFSLAWAIKKYKLTPQDMVDRGFPTELVDLPGHAMIKSVLYPAQNGPTAINTANIGNDSGHCTGSSPDNSDQEQESQSYNEKNANSEKSLDSEKGFGIDNSSEKSLDNDKSLDSGKGSDNEKSIDNEKSLDKSDSEKGDTEHVNELATSTEERKCVRCQKVFYVDQNGEYLCTERCVYHWGKMHNGLINGMMNGNWYWTCCQKPDTSHGCAEANMHVWTGLIPGFNNGPFAGYVRTESIYLPDGNYGVYSLDCEMCYTRYGLELTKVTVVNLNGKVVYDTLVKPSSEIIEYNTKFSGITEKHMLNVTKTLEEVQRDLLSFIYAETILMGHGLASDFRALRLFHANVVDTTVMFPHFLGFPYCNALKTLSRRVLKREVQETVHDSIEDARAVVDLVLQKVSYDWNESPIPQKTRILTRQKDLPVSRQNC